MNYVFSEHYLAADGRYLEKTELNIFEQYIHTYPVRLQTYQTLHSQSNQVILDALKQLSKKYPTLVRKTGKQCHHDMTVALRYIALSILRDDLSFFQNSILLWLDSVIVAHQKQSPCAEAYTYLLEEIQSQMPNDGFSIVRPYIDSIIQLLNSHVY